MDTYHYIIEDIHFVKPRDPEFQKGRAQGMRTAAIGDL